MDVEIHEVVKKKYAHKGRPKKGEEPQIETVWNVEVKIGEMNTEVYEQKKREESTFVLIHRTKEEMTSAEIVKSYKNQDKVERGFKFLKQPQYLGPTYTKIQSRVEALGYIFLIVLVIAKYLEFRVRVVMQENQGILKIGGQKVLNPSAQTIIELLNKILVYEMNGIRYFRHNMNENILNVLRWTGFDKNVYLNGKVIDLFHVGNDG